jgi:hypothetical protein
VATGTFEGEVQVVAKPSFSTLQSLVALAAGLTSIGGAAYSAIGHLQTSPAPGELAAIVREAGTEKVVRGAVVEVRTPDDAIVTTMTQGDDGVARRAVAPGTYHVRVVHPAFAEAVRDVRVEPGTRSELRVGLEPHQRAAERSTNGRAAPTRAGPATAPGRALDRGVVATRRLLGRLGL